MDPKLVREETKPRRFITTRWSVVLAAGSDPGAAAQNALSHLCQIYWRPIFAFICRLGHSTTDAQDLTQDFFVSVMEGRLLQSARPDRGQFRSLLLASLQNFLNDSHDRACTKKRGGRVEFVAWDHWMAEAPSHLSLSERALEIASPERLFDIRWAATVVERAMARLREECETRGRRRIFDTLSCCLASDRTEISYAELAGSLGVTEVMIRRLLSQLRKRYRAILRDEVSRTVLDATEVEEEIRYLCAALAAGPE